MWHAGISEHSRGKLAKKIKRMERFVVDFRIAKNITAPVGEKTVYVRIMKPDDDVLVKSRADVFPFEGKDINYWYEAGNPLYRQQPL